MTSRATTPAILLTLAALAVTALAVVPAAPSALAYERQPELERVVALPVTSTQR